MRLKPRTAEIIEWGLCCKSELVSNRRHSTWPLNMRFTWKAWAVRTEASSEHWRRSVVAETQNDGRLVQWQLWPDDLSAEVPIEKVTERQIDVVIRESSSQPLVTGIVNVGKTPPPQHGPRPSHTVG